MINALPAFISPSPMEILIVAFIILLLFGKRLPQVMGSIGRSIVEFKKGARGIEDEDEQRSSETLAPKSEYERKPE